MSKKDYKPSVDHIKVIAIKSNNGTGVQGNVNPDPPKNVSIPIAARQPPPPPPQKKG